MKSDFIGGLIAVGAAVASIFGVNLQKYSHDKEETRAKPRPYHLRPMWWVGMICVVAASLGDFLALGFAPQTLVASLGGGSTILGNCLMSRFWLKQSLYITDITGVALVTLGVVILAAASEGEPGHYKMDQIYQLMQAAPFILYCLITTAFVMTLYLRVRRSKAPALRVAASTDDKPVSGDDAQRPDSVRLNPINKKDSSDVETASTGSERTSDVFVNRSALMSPFPSPVFGGKLTLSPTRLAGEEDDPLDDDNNRLRKLDGDKIEKHTLIIDPKLPLYWAAISGTIGAQSVLLAKCVVELISSTFNGDNQFLYFGTYVLVGGMVATLLTQTHTLNMATMTGDTMSAYPVFQAFWISMSNISGVVFFQQAHDFTRTQWMLFPSAIVLVLLGIYLVSKHQKFGNRVKYSVAMPISLSSPRQHDIVAQSFVFRVLTPQRLQDEEEDYDQTQSAAPGSPRRRRASLDVV
ncbi:hypothetical protein Poli38472_000037 [Pythium oligandrum]|uniref:Magnesium transporter n=1 Tax=Pythium oligandrum TaxID=41045 RepID=A0A8K1CBC6_PYTOL|nr:hypothetical protein Poli38472_000037 [Pythium oligandrum]|eukprot:TMW59995.1 hypothetical protein Poli38472_000037 [Pythium oligandrum]